MKHLSIPLFNFTLILHLSASAALPIHWDVDLGAQPPQVFTLQRPRGETYELEAVLKNRGKPFAPAITNACIYWQTNGMENLYWSAPASVSTNTVPAASSPRGVAETNYCLRATWLPSMDPGASTVRGYIGDPGHIYAAAFQFRFIASPGATPNALPLPVPVIDFAKVTVLNPPWSGGGSEAETNLIRDIIHKTVDGSARPLPPYLHYLEMDDTYPDAAAEWYAQADYSHGSCSARRTGNLLERNYDWNFDFMPEFVIRVPAASERFASIAVCNVGTNLTETDVNSGKWSKWYKALPGHAVDGVNENGVVCEVNVCPTNGVEGWTGTEVHCLGGVRYALDHATNAAHAASLLAEKVYVPQGYGNFHYMVADETSTYIVENGSAHAVSTGVPVLTNFRLYPARDTTGEGQERYDALASGANITSQWWTLTYTPDGYRASDLPGITGEDLTNLFNYWGNNPRESHRGERFGDKVWWQTLHTSVYDITNKTLRISVQETDDWYTFAVPSAGGVKPEAVREIVRPMIGDATNDLSKTLNDSISQKRDKTDLDVYSSVFTPWTCKEQFDYGDEDIYDFEMVFIAEEERWYLTVDGETDYTEGSSEDVSQIVRILDRFFFLKRSKTGIVHSGSKLAHTSETYGLAKFGADGELTAATPGTDYLKRNEYGVIEGGLHTNGNIDTPNEITRQGVPVVYSVNGDYGDVTIDIPTISATDPTFSNEVATVVRTVQPTTLRLYDETRGCYWIGKMVNGVLNWEVE